MEWPTRPNELLTVAATESVGLSTQSMAPMKPDDHEYAQEWQSDRREMDHDSKVRSQQRISLRSADSLSKSVKRFSREQ